MNTQTVTQFIDPNLVSQLKGKIASQENIIAELKEENKLIVELKEKNELITEQYDSLLRQVRELTRQMYGCKNERYIPNQGLLFDLENIALPEPETEEVAYTRRKRQNNNHSHHNLPEGLRRERIIYEIPESERLCPCNCGKTLERIGEVVSERLEYKPAELYVKQHIRFKYGGCAQDSCILTADMPTLPVARSIAGPSLLSKIIVDKYEFHQPLHRQQSQLARQGIKLNGNSFYDWLCQTFALLAVLYEALKKDVLTCPIINTDDTPSKVRVKGETKAKKGYFWIYVGSEEKLKPLSAVYIYTQTREGKWAQEFLADYEGYIQADAFSGYDKLFNEEDVNHPRVEVGCMMHARRGFFKITTQTKKAGAAHMGLSYIQNLYKIEEKIKNYSPEERYQVRQEEAVPILNEFKTWLDATAIRALKKSPLLKAAQYCLNHWDALTRYTEDGRLDIDNGISERGMRPIGLGRNNWISLGSHVGGELAALFYSFIETCKLHKINSYEYFTDVLTRIQDYPASRIEELLPYNWVKRFVTKSAKEPENTS